MAAVCLIPVYALLLVYLARWSPEMAVCLFSAVYRERCENPGDCVVDLRRFSGNSLSWQLPVQESDGQIYWQLSG